MQTLLLRDGDLVPSHRDFLRVTGAGKVAQDLRCALLEPLGNDRFHPGWGSTLDQFIAIIANENSRAEVEAEVNRVIANYAAIQRDKVEVDINSNAEPRYSTDEILSRIGRVEVTIAYETVHVDISVVTVAGEVVVLAEAVA